MTTQTQSPVIAQDQRELTCWRAWIVDSIVHEWMEGWREEQQPPEP